MCVAASCGSTILRSSRRTTPTAVTSPRTGLMMRMRSQVYCRDAASFVTVSDRRWRHAMHSFCPTCGMEMPVPPRTRVRCGHPGHPEEKRYVSDIVTSIASTVVESTCVEEPLFEVEHTRTHTRDNF